LNATFWIDTESMTPRNDAMAAAFSQQKCGGNAAWAVDTAGDVSQTGCLFVASVTACPAEYDLVKVDATTLHFGQRPMMGDICDAARRPTSLSMSSFTRSP
jgi:hypothetical protein